MPGISSECDKGCSKRSCKAFCRLHHQADYECYPISHGTITLLSDIEKNTLQRITIAGSCANKPCPRVPAFRAFDRPTSISRACSYLLRQPSTPHSVSATPGTRGILRQGCFHCCRDLFLWCGR